MWFVIIPHSLPVSQVVMGDPQCPSCPCRTPCGCPLSLLGQLVGFQGTGDPTAPLLIQLRTMAIGALPSRRMCLKIIPGVFVEQTSCAESSGT